MIVLDRTGQRGRVRAENEDAFLVDREQGLSLLFFLSELMVHIRIAIGNFSMLRVTDRSPQADESERAVRVWHLDRLKERLDAIGFGW